MEEVWNKVDSYQALRFAQAGASYGVKRSWRPDVYWFYGPTGVGKTREAYRLAPDAYFTTATLQWWDGYDGHEDVIVDDFRSSFCKLEYLLRLLDRYPFQVAIKGGHRQFLAKRIFITSAFSPSQLFSDGGDNVNQLLRRIKEVRHFSQLAADIESEEARGSLVGGWGSPVDDAPAVPSPSPGAGFSPYQPRPIGGPM
jgi:hypothetical protein